MLLGSVVGGAFMFGLGLMVSKTWSLYRRRRSGDYVGVEDTTEPHRLDTSGVPADFYGTHVINPRSRTDNTG